MLHDLNIRADSGGIHRVTEWGRMQGQGDRRRARERGGGLREERGGEREGIFFPERRGWKVSGPHMLAIYAL